MYSFSAPIERFEMEGAWDYVAIPHELSDALKAQKVKRVQVSINETHPYACGMLPTGDGRLFIIMSQQRQKDLGMFLGAWVHVDLWEDRSKYGMPVPEDLQELFEFDPGIQDRFDLLLPGKRRNYLHRIAQAKTEATRTKRIAGLLKDLGLE